jgi:hypothetical protein
MLGIQFIKTDPTTYLMQYRNGRIAKEGLGLSFFYYAQNSSLVKISTGSQDMPFIFKEMTSDFQEVTVQGQITCKVAEPKTLSSMLNYTINQKGGYVSDDPQKLPRRIVNMVQVEVRKEIANFSLKKVIAASDAIENAVYEAVSHSKVLSSLGVEVLDFSILAIKPNTETARALEAETREMLLKRADEATYDRRNSAIEQERAIKENELKTEIAVEEKKRQIQEAQLNSEMEFQQKHGEMLTAEMQNNIALEKQRESLVDLKSVNKKKEAETRAYAVEANMKAISKTDPKTLQALATVNMDPAQLIAASFRELSENANKIGQLNISPDLLSELLSKKA